MEVRLQNPGEGPGGPGPPLFLDQNEARRTEKIFFEAGPAPLSEGLHDRPQGGPPPPPGGVAGPPTPPPPPPLSEDLDLPLDCNQFALKKERERAHASQIL